jgi:hypothetical protein
LTDRVLALQRQAGNRAVVRLMSAPRLSRMTFARFQTYGRLSNWGSYNAREQRLLGLEQELTDLLTTIKPWMAAQRGRVAGLATRARTALATANAGPLSEQSYAKIDDELAASFDKLSHEIRRAAYDVLRETFYAPNAALARAGGGDQKVKLAELAFLAGKDPARLEPLLALAGGDARAFDRLHTLTLRFPQAYQPAPASPQPPSAVPFGYPGGANMNHFLERHTYDWFDFGDIKAVQAFWPPGTTGADVSGHLEEALQVLHPWYLPARTYASYQPVPSFKLGSGFTVKVGFNAPGGQKRIGQFYPEPDPRTGVESVTKNEMEAIQAVLGRVN